MIMKGIDFLYGALQNELSKITDLVLYFTPHLLPERTRLSRVKFVERACFLFFIGGTIIFVLFHIKNANTSWPSFKFGTKPEGEIYQILDRGIGLQTSSLFRGRLANIAKIKPQPLPDGRLYAYEAMQALDHYIAFTKTSGTDFRHSTLANDIPTLFDVTRFASPGSVASMNYFLTEPMHYKQSQFLYPSKFDIHWMEFFGIRYVIHNEILADAPPPVASQDYGNYQLYLYEIPNPNIGNYTPTEQIVAGSLPLALTIMADQELNFRKTVIVEAPISVPLVQATSAELEIVRGTLTFSGVSSGWSLAILPFEYSNCLQIMPNTDFSGALPTLQRVNSHQIGLLFNKETSVKISFLFSLFDNKQCRKKDLKEWQKLDARGAESFNGINIFGSFVK